MEMLVGQQGVLRRVPVCFAGPGSGTAPLTWAQQEHWKGIVEAGHAATFGGAFPMPAGTTVEQVAELLRFSLSRHQALRSRLCFDAGGQPRQVCFDSGEIDLAVLEAGSADPGELAERLYLEYRLRDFDFENEWPVRMAVITAGGILTHLVVVYLHLAVDGGGIAALLADLAARDPATGAPAGPVTAPQPAELARQQAGPGAQRQSAASLRYFQHVWRTADPALFGSPARGGAARYHALRYRSPATGPALQRIAAEQDASLSSAMLAVFAVGLARFLGRGSVWAMLLVSNRFRPGLADSVCIAVQSSPCMLDVAGISLAEAVTRARAGLLQTYKNAYYDSLARDRLIEGIVLERGAAVQICCYYNDRLGVLPPPPGSPASDAQLRAVLGTGRCEDDFAGPALPRFPLFFNVEFSDGTIYFPMTYDARYFDRSDLVSLAEHIEAAAVQAAVSPEAPTGIPAAAQAR